MSVQKSVELTGTESTVEHAVTEAVDPRRDVARGHHLVPFDRIDGILEQAEVMYRMRLRVFFTLMERMHG